MTSETFLGYFYFNEKQEEATLFWVQDIPVMKVLGLYREEGYRENGGRQKVTGKFEG